MYSEPIQTAINHLIGYTNGSTEFNDWLEAAKQYHATYDASVTGRRELFNVVSYNEFLAGKDPEQAPLTLGGDVIDSVWICLANDFAQALLWAKEDMQVEQMANANSDKRHEQYSTAYPVLLQRWKDLILERKRFLLDIDARIMEARIAKDKAKQKG